MRDVSEDLFEPAAATSADVDGAELERQPDRTACDVVNRVYGDDTIGGLIGRIDRAGMSAVLLLARLAAGLWRGTPLATGAAQALLSALARVPVDGRCPAEHTDATAPAATPPALLALTRSPLTSAPPARPALAALGAAAA